MRELTGFLLSYRLFGSLPFTEVNYFLPQITAITVSMSCLWEATFKFNATNHLLKVLESRFILYMIAIVASHCEYLYRIAQLITDSGNDFVNTVNNSVTTHQRNLQLLMIEIFKTKNDLNPTFMKDILAGRDKYYSLRNINHLQLPKVRTTMYGTENIQYRGCLLWYSLPSFLKDSSTIQEFKRKITQWNGDSCTCRLCRVFIKDFEFFD